MKKVLILTAAFGEGHNTAARNIRDALDILSGDVRVQVLDLFESSYGSFYTIARKTHLGVVQYAPKVWSGIYSLLDSSKTVGRNLGSLSRLKNALEDIIHEVQPDCVVSTYPLYGHVIQEVYRDYKERPFRLITVVTDSITVNAAWYRAQSDYFCVPNKSTSEVLTKAGLPEAQVRDLGFPVNHLFAEAQFPLLTAPRRGEARKILYIVNSGKKKCGAIIDQLLEIPDVQLTITVGRDAKLKAKLIERTQVRGDRVRVLGWTNQMPELMMSHHLIIGKAGGATVQEAIAARCPMIINQIIPGQEEGNARLIENLGLGAVAESDAKVTQLVEEVFAYNSKLWMEWRENLSRISRPDASLRIAELILNECERSDVNGGKLSSLLPERSRQVNNRLDLPDGGSKMLLCDLHIHSNYSDGKLSVPDVIDFYGQRGFDCICITDHLADPRRLIGKLAELSSMTLSQDQIEEYFEVIERERRRAWRKYKMLVMTGIEFNKDGFSKKSSAHLLGIDLKAPIDAGLDLTETINQIHKQGGLAIASHPHIMKSEWGKNTLHLWMNQDQYAPLIDAWEIANRNNLFTPVGLKNLPFIANSDFHKPKHIYSWKTILHCEKDPNAIKQCIRKNQDVAITLYRDFSGAGTSRRCFIERSDRLKSSLFQEDLPLAVAPRFQGG